VATNRLRLTHPSPLNHVYGVLQAYCVGACCGYQAYDINAWRLLNEVDLDGDEWLFTGLDQLDRLFEAIALHKGREITDGEMWWKRKTECVDFYQRIQTEMLRALVELKGRTVFDPTWLEYNQRAADLLARSIRRRRSYGDAPVLADALEEAGCATGVLLTRCRSTNPDARANWIVELLIAGSEGVFNRPIEPTPEPTA
jgi:hypothetical protein